MAVNETNITNIHNLRANLSTLIQQIYNNDLVAGQTNSTACKALMDALDIAVQAATNLTDLP